MEAMAGALFSVFHMPRRAGANASAAPHGLSTLFCSQAGADPEWRHTILATWCGRGDHRSTWVVL